MGRATLGTELQLPPTSEHSHLHPHPHSHSARDFYFCRVYYFTELSSCCFFHRKQDVVLFSLLRVHPTQQLTLTLGPNPSLSYFYALTARVLRSPSYHPSHQRNPPLKPCVKDLSKRLLLSKQPYRMARVVRRAASASVRRAPSRAVQRRARKHKVIMESVTQEKKKLQSVVCFPFVGERERERERFIYERGDLSCLDL